MDHVPDAIDQMILLLARLEQEMDWHRNSSMTSPIPVWSPFNLQELQLAASRLLYFILLQYLKGLVSLKQLPYRFPDTHTLILGNLEPLDFEYVLESLEK
jgi:hypothetical protein